ncbi:MAG: hypothetical protein HZB20_04795 [Chloroflexi bacterium]|nr:hypothetical protein [Chloroflexota bacterium]
MKTLILGLGNPILGDDALGLRVAALVRQRLPPGSAIEVDEEYWGGLRLMERLVGYDKAILIDAICTGTHVLDFCEQCSPAVSAALPAVVERVLAAVN